MLTKVGESYMKIMSTIRCLTPQPILTTADTISATEAGVSMCKFLNQEAINLLTPLA